MGASRLLAVTEPGFEAFTIRSGLPVQRSGGPIVAGHSHDRDVYAVLISFDINPYTLASVGITAEAA